jgi:glucarate dehydratase
MSDWTRRRWIASAAGITGLGGLPDMARAFDPQVPGAKRPRSRMKISALRATLVASPDFALLRSSGVHDTHFKRTIVEVETADGFKGVGETTGRAEEEFTQAREVVLGRDPFEIEYFRRNVKSIHAFGAIETACLDLIGKTINRRVVDLLGGPYRDAMRFSAYVFFVLPTPEGPDITTPEAVTKEFVEMCKKYGFRSLKFKGGVLHPDREIEALQEMRKAMPEAPLRIDPNAAWSVETAVRVAKAIEPLKMEYFEDPSPGLDGMAEVRKQTKLPLATNMVVTRIEHVAPAVRKESVDIILLDNHYMGGLVNCRHWAAICESLGWGCSGHSNNHLGISMAAMTHMNCAISRVSYDADTHYPWTREDVIKGPKLEFKDGKMALPDAPGLGVEVDSDKLAALKENVAKAKDRKALLEKWSPGYPNARPGSRIRW